jgi:hypothetical protein
MSMSLSQARVIDPVLSKHVQGYRNPEFVGMAVFPSVEVTVSGGKVIEFGREAFVRYAARRSPGSATKRVPLGHFGRDYRLVNEALDAEVPRELAREAAEVADVDMAMRAVDVVMRALRLGLEIDQAAIARNTATYAASNRTALAAGSRWSDAGVDPAVAIDAGMEAIRAATGMYPNVMLLPSKVYRALRRNSAARSMFAGTSAGALGPEQIARAYDIERVVVAGGVQASTAEPLTGPAPANVFSDIWGTDVILAYAPETPTGMEEPSFGFTYTMKGNPFVEKERWDGNTKSWVYGVSYERAPVLSGISAGYLIQTAAA